MKRVLLGMSGGVDSTVGAWLLREQGYDVLGLTLWLWDPAGSLENRCCSVDTAALAARELGIPHEVVHAEAAFRRLVVEPTLAAYRRGLTPNPCALCNREVRFALLVAEADRRGIPFVATGHHARVRWENGRGLLLRGRDPNKDQSYFLYGLTQGELSRALLPVGELVKDEIKGRARELGLTAAQLPESQDLCFAPEGVAGLIAGAPPGPILDLSGREVGEHKGLPHYTVGQRRGLGIASPEPLYVVALDPKRNAVIVGPERALYADGLVATDLRWIAGEPPADRFSAEVQIRYRASPVPAEVEVRGDEAWVRFAEPQRAVTPGQAAVLYREEVTLGGGTIARAYRR
ncbi:MAG: tRNA 2-thiouridine(34) synthase MnmA [Candidatus Acetothermia bacterium]|jgi:tRNA-specific 2-thiouridylase|nr:tRNA 2-thiouridine(34) synthase MnmA [Candidatus Acetothermia bacterium]